MKDTIFLREEFGLQEFIRFSKEKKGVYGSGQKSSEENDKDLTGTKSYQEALDLVENGWDEGAKKILAIKEKLEFIGKKTSFKPIYDVSGESVDVGRYLSGEPECMQEWEMIEEVGNRVVDIYFNISASAGVPSKEIMNYGAATLSIVDYLESLGVRVNLYAYWASIMSGKKTLLTVKIKSANESISIASIAFPVSHTSFMRRLAFKWYEQHSEVRDWGYGMPTEFSREEITNESDSILFPGIRSTGGNFTDMIGTEKYLRKTLNNVLNELKIDTEFNRTEAKEWDKIQKNYGK